MVTVRQLFDKGEGESEGGDQYHRFEESLDCAAANDVSAAYLIDTFELWFYLHYEAVMGAIHREQLYADLSQRWGMGYVA
jgi:hypothetical protein